MVFMRRKLIVGNWKMNGSLGANSALLDGIIAGVRRNDCGVAMCVPFPYLAQCSEMLRGTPVALGAQDVSAHQSGAFTGEVSAEMLCEFGCTYVIVGHSERRSYHAESDEMVARKAAAALGAGLTPIFCVGETLEQRDAGQTEHIVYRQLDALLDAVDGRELARVVVAYEPVWAIGTGKTATPDMAQEVHQSLRERIARRNVTVAEAAIILYGGSMKPDNARELLGMPDIDGGLIGGASLKSPDFLAIVDAA
jgi:triosephosphate isomerase